MDFINRFQFYKRFLFLSLFLALICMVASLFMGFYLIVKTRGAHEQINEFAAHPQTAQIFVENLQLGGISLITLGLCILIFGIILPIFLSYQLSQMVLEVKNQIEGSVRGVLRDFLNARPQGETTGQDRTLLYLHFALQAVLGIAPFFKSQRAHGFFDIVMILKSEIALHLSEKSKMMGK